MGSAAKRKKKNLRKRRKLIGWRQDCKDRGEVINGNSMINKQKRGGGAEKETRRVFIEEKPSLSFLRPGEIITESA